MRFDLHGVDTNICISVFAWQVGGRGLLVVLQVDEAYLGPYQTSMVGFIAKIINC